ncbi:MAG: hypothetical protein FJ304_19610 [Planctomycetes bacterium]|nr:hypothetical protein [Planctomycetota bacterium]
MPDIRLALCLPDDATRAAVAARLRGASVVSVAECDAALLAGFGDAEELLRAGRHVLVAGAPSPTARDVFTHEARRAGVGCTFVNPDRFLPSRQLIRKQLGGPLGEAGLVRAHRWEPHTDNPERVPEPLLRDIDLALWFVGRAPERVFAVENRTGVGSVIQLHLGFAGGASALLDFTDALPPGDGYSSLSVIAASGAVYADDQHNTQLLYGGARPRAARACEGVAALAGLAQAFVTALCDGRTVEAGDWTAVHAVARAATESLARGAAEVLP